MDPKRGGALPDCRLIADAGQMISSQLAMRAKVLEDVLPVAIGLSVAVVTGCR